MTNKLNFFFITAFTIFWLSVSTLACTCASSSVEANKLAGQIFALEKLQPDQASAPNYQEPIPKADFILWENHEIGGEENKIIAKVNADNNGRFSFENIKPGKYLLMVNAAGFESFAVEVTLSEGSDQTNDKFVIGLAPPLACCRAYIMVKKEEMSGMIGMADETMRADFRTGLLSVIY